MDHDQAQRDMLTERYLLDELSPQQREEFEEHYFNCQQCALDLSAVAAFLDHSKAVLSADVAPAPARVEQPAKGWGWLRPAFSVPVLALLLIVISYQAFVSYPHLKQEALLAQRPQILPALSLINAASRGDNKATVTARKAEPFLLFVDVPTDKHFPSYEAKLYDPAGTEVWSLTIPSALTNDTLSIEVPGRRTAGNYVLVVRGEDTSKQYVEIGRFPFDLQFQK